MSTYDQDEESIEGSRPIHLYTFTFATQIFRRTSYPRDLIVSGLTYSATPIRHGLSTLSSGIEPPENTIELPRSDLIVQAYCGKGIAPQRVDVLVERYQTTSTVKKRLFGGRVAYCKRSKNVASFVVSVGTGDPLANELPTAVISRRCNHVFGDTLCGIDRTLHQITPTIASISGRDVTLSSAGIYTGGELQYGDILHVPSGERRSIVTHAGTLITLDALLPNTAGNGDALVVTRGCDHRVFTCRTVYNNVIRFGGHPHLDSSNFFYVDLRYARNT